MGFCALIPAYNEAARITKTVTAARAIRAIDHVVVIDDGSSDETSALARAAGAEVLNTNENAGKGAALNRGLAHLRAGSTAFDGVILLDGDLAESAHEADKLLEPLVQGSADMTIAAFPKPLGKAGFGLVKKLAAFGIRRYGSPEFSPTAPLSGQRALNQAALDACTPFEVGYGVEVALTAHALRAGLRVAEVPTTMTHAATGRDVAGFVHRGRQFIDVARAVIRLSRER